MGLVWRSFDYLGIDMFKILFSTFVWPHLEHAQAVWTPHLKKHVYLIENVQWRSTKRDISYSERLCLPTLAFRRKVNDIVELYKHFHIYYRASLSKLSIRIPVQVENRNSNSCHEYRVTVPEVSRQTRFTLEHCEQGTSFPKRLSILPWPNRSKGY